jgi:hypothetical protein
MPPDTAERRPVGRTGAQNDARGDGNVNAILDAWRCWSWRTRHACGCPTADDCLLVSPLPVHDPQPCRGMFGDGGRWRPCCGRGAA